jgi:hypothetical protein
MNARTHHAMPQTTATPPTIKKHNTHHAQQLQSMSIRFSALLLCKPWAPEIFTLNLETCSADCEIPSSKWDRVAVALAPSREQSLMFQLLQEWWHATAATLTKERQVIGPTGCA